MRLPAVAALPSFQPPALQRSRLANGIELLTVQKSALPIVDMQIVARGGATLDSALNAGRASLTAEMLDEGTRMHSALEISERVELMGAQLSTRAGWDATLISMHGLAPRFEGMLDIITELVLEPSFPEQDFRRKRDERLHGLMQERDEPRLVALKALARAVFGTDHPFGRPAAGTLATVEALTCADLQAFYTETFVSARMHAIVVGDIRHDEVAAALEKRFAGLKPGAAAVAADLPGIDGIPGIHLIDKPGAAQSEVRFGHPGVSRATPDFFPLLLMNTILGGSFKSRLNMKLREEKGFTYGASTAFSFRREGGSFGGGAAVGTDSTAETVALSLAEVVRMRDQGVTSEELARARSYLALGFMRNFETTTDIAAQLAELALHDLPNDHLQHYAEQVETVTVTDIARVARRYLQPDQLSFVIVGDAALVRSPLQQLALGPVRESEAE